MELQKIETHRSFGGQQIKYRHLSEMLHCEMTFSVYLPETTVENQEIPLIWWLAGLTSTDDNFSIKGGFQRYAKRTANRLRHAGHIASGGCC